MEDRKTICTDKEIEDMLSPKCEFHPSPGLMENVLAETERISLAARKCKKKLWFVRSCAGAAAVAALAFMAATVLHYQEGKDIPHVQYQAKTAMGLNNQVSIVKPAIDTEAPALTHNKGESIIEEDENISRRHGVAIRNKVHNVTDFDNDKEDIIESEQIEEIKTHVSETYIETTEQLIAATDELDDCYGSLRRPYIVKVRYEITESESETKEIRENKYICESI